MTCLTEGYKSAQREPHAQPIDGNLRRWGPHREESRLNGISSFRFANALSSGTAKSSWSSIVPVQQLLLFMLLAKVVLRLGHQGLPVYL
jgi:hypothetical protein